MKLKRGNLLEIHLKNEKLSLYDTFLYEKYRPRSIFTQVYPNKRVRLWRFNLYIPIPMILEVAILYIRSGQQEPFEKDFAKAGKNISSMQGYCGHSLQKCIEEDNKYLLFVNWNTIEDHTIHFRQSEQYQLWKKLLHHYYDPFPTVEHYEIVLEKIK